MHSVAPHGSTDDASVAVDKPVWAMLGATSDHMHSDVFSIHDLLKLRPSKVNTSTGLAVKELESLHIDWLEGLPDLKLLRPGTLGFTPQILVDFSSQKHCLRDLNVVGGGLVIITVAKSI